MPLHHKSQSALEYLMTYGWAILIIVIVAVILYSMGIFNPSSSVSFSSSGFSPFTVSSSSCNSIGYKIAVIAGPIPNNANSLQITKVYVISAAGANISNSVYTLPSPVTLTSGKSAVIIVPNVACNAINVKYSFSAIIQYTYTVPSIGNQIINTSGTVAGTSIAGKPSILTSYEPLTITNTQTSATPSPFQQMINMTSTDPGWSSIATSNFAQNVEFFYYNGSVIPSWLESYTSSKAIWWLKLPSISNSMVIYMGFAPSTTSLFNNVNTGEAPQLPCGSTPTSSCSLYGRYDDGADVFNFYNNFAGNTLKNFLEDGASSTITINNGISFNFGSSSIVGVYLPTSYNYTKNSIFSYYLTGFSVIGTNYWVGGGISSSSSLGGTAYIRDEGLGEDWGNGIPTFGAGVQYGNTLINTYPTSTTVGDVIGLNSIYDINMTYLKTTNPTGTALWELPGGAREKLLAPFYWELGGWNSASGDVLNISYTYIRTYPPEGVMPSVSFGSIS